MKVTLLNDSFPPVIDGVANVVMNYAKIMQEEGLADVMVATPEYPGAEYNIYPYIVLPYKSFDTTKIVKGYRAGNPLDVKEIIAMKEFQPDIIHSHCPVSSTLLARTLRFYTDTPIVFTYHTKFDIDIAKAVKAKFIQKEAIRALVNNIEACDEVWVVSNGAGENLRSLGYEGDYRVVSNGVDFEKGRVAPEDVARVTAAYDLPQNTPVFLFVGRLVKYKGLPLILDALAKLSADGIDFRMVFVGSGPDEAEMKEKAARLLKPEQYIFTGSIYDRDELRAWNTRADLFLFPSTYDTNGIVVREAAACGLASVLISGSCASEGVTDDRNGFLIEENADSMYSLLKRLSNDLSHIHTVGENAMNEIYISWKDSVHRAHERYCEIIEAKKSGKLVLRHNILSNSIHYIHEKVHDSIKITDSFKEQFKKEYALAYDDFMEEYEKIINNLHFH